MTEPSSNNTVTPVAFNMNGNSTNAQAGPSTPPRHTQTNGDIQMKGGLSPKPANANGEAGPDMSNLFMAKREEELARRDRSLAEFLVMLDGYKPVVSGGLLQAVIQLPLSDLRLLAG